MIRVFQRCVQTGLAASLLCALTTHATASDYTARAYVFGTIAEITVAGEDPKRARELVGAVFRDFDRMHRELHAWQPGELASLNQAIARGERAIWTTSEIAQLIRDTQALAERSDQLFNPAIGKLVGLWSFHRSKPGGVLPDAREITKLVEDRPRMSDLTVTGNLVTSSNRAVQLDFGGYAKGHALDRAARLFARSGIKNALVNLGGNMLALGHHGARPWRVGIQHPRHAGVLATLELRDGEAIGTSGDYERYFVIDGKRYSHIIDPRTGYPVPGVQSVTVLVPKSDGAGALSDGGSKPIFIAGPVGWRDAAREIGISTALLVDGSGKVHATRAMFGRLRVTDPNIAFEVAD